MKIPTMPISLLGVKKSTLDTYGAVSEQTALEMVKGVIRNSNADIGVSITGIAGPTGDTKNKPENTDNAYQSNPSSVLLRIYA
jgi:PncC family amidohydrolase